MDQKQLPLYEAIEEYIQKQTARFHVPGHKGRGTGPFAMMNPYDVTEIPGLDDLHQAQDAILHAQQLAAEVFHADNTFFLVGGSTIGNIAMIMTAVGPGEVILVQRNVHKSVIHGLILAQACPVYLRPQIDDQTGLATSVSLRELRHAINTYPQAKAVFLSNPNYFGMGVDLTSYAELCQSHSLPLLVDEAHGAHFGLIPELPPSAMQAGATAAIQSTHKMLTSMTMSSMLHVQGKRLNLPRLKRVLAMLQSSSPSYPLLASLDLARHYAVDAGRMDLRQVLQWAGDLAVAISEQAPPWLYIVKKCRTDDYLDPFKITLRSESAQWNGFVLKQYLEEQGIYPEMADQHHVLLALSALTTEKDLEQVYRAIQKLDHRDGERDSARTFPPFEFAQKVDLTPHEVFYLETREVLLEHAEGCVCGEIVAPYPPGVPVVNPGERIDRNCLLYLQRLRELGCRFHGAADPKLYKIQVVN